MREVVDQLEAVNRAFTSQSAHYDQDDRSNPILQSWRSRIYKHVANYLKPASRLLELNSGTGIDAMYFAKQGHQVLATDISDGMIEQLQRKTGKGEGNLRVKQLSYENLDELRGEQFDYVFSNFGGLNCLRDLTSVVRGVSSLLAPRGYVTWVVMPPISLWELAWVFTRNWKLAGRRLKKDGALAHIEGQYFRTFYHSLASLRKAFGAEFTLVQSEGLGVFLPPPSRTAFAHQHPKANALLQSLEHATSRVYPFNRVGDHLIVTFQKKSMNGIPV